MKHKQIFLLICIYPFFFITSCSSKQSEVKLNQIQIIGSHNSYKVKIQEELLAMISQYDSLLANALEYEHIGLTEQLNLGIRSLEIDVFNDPQGGHYSNPLGQVLLAENGLPPLPFDEKNQLEKPGLKVFHIQDIDFRSHNPLFKDNLLEIKEWSENNPNHTPLVILINAKDAQPEKLSRPVPFSEMGLDSIDLEIKKVFTKSQLITPDDVRGNYETLEESVTKGGWPTLKQSRGKLLFFLDVGDDKKELYIKNHYALKNRMMFVNAPEGSAEAGFMLLNNPIDSFDRIKELIKKGYIVRTRADEDTQEARKNDFERFNKAVKSGAQVISTDYYRPSKMFQSTYAVSFDDQSFVREKSITRD